MADWSRVQNVGDSRVSRTADQTPSRPTGEQAEWVRWAGLGWVGLGDWVGFGGVRWDWVELGDWVGSGVIGWGWVGFGGVQWDWVELGDWVGSGVIGWDWVVLGGGWPGSVAWVTPAQGGAGRVIGGRLLKCQESWLHPFLKRRGQVLTPSAHQQGLCARQVFIESIL